MDFFDVESHVRLSLPAAQHQVVYFFRTGPGALQHPALGYTLYHLQRRRERQASSLTSRCSFGPSVAKQTNKEEFRLNVRPPVKMTELLLGEVISPHSRGI